VKQDIMVVGTRKGGVCLPHGGQKTDSKVGW
jgi:hypothetical protein